MHILSLYMLLMISDTPAWRYMYGMGAKKFEAGRPEGRGPTGARGWSHKHHPSIIVCLYAWIPCRGCAANLAAVCLPVGQQDHQGRHVSEPPNLQMQTQGGTSRRRSSSDTLTPTLELPVMARQGISGPGMQTLAGCSRHLLGRSRWV